MNDQTKKENDGNKSKIIVSITEIEIPEEKKEFLAYVSCFVLESMELSADVRDQKYFLSNGLQLCVMEAVEAILKDKYFEGIIWEGAIGRFLKEFRSLKDGSYDPLAFLKLNFEEEISRIRRDLASYDLHIPEA